MIRIGTYTVTAKRSGRGYVGIVTDGKGIQVFATVHAVGPGSKAFVVKLSREWAWRETERIETERMNVEAGRIVPHIRWMIRVDMPEVLAIEDACGPGWTEEDFLRALRQRNCIGMIAENADTNKLVGFMLYELHTHKLVVLNFVVHPDWHRKGVGRAMIGKLMSKLSSHRRTRLEFRVDERNLRFLTFLKHLSFRGKIEPGSESILMAYGDDEPIQQNRVAQFLEQEEA